MKCIIDDHKNNIKKNKQKIIKNLIPNLYLILISPNLNQNLKKNQLNTFY